MPAIPPTIWPSDNAYGIPTLRLDGRRQQHFAPPLTTWGTIPRGSAMAGTWSFYTDDYKFAALWSDPRPVIRSGCAAVIEPNFSCYDDSPLVVCLNAIYRKRWLARYWQEHGIDIYVDLNVSRKVARENLLGVPAGWQHFATRGYYSRIDDLHHDYALAVETAGTKDIEFLVCGGSRKLRKVCEYYGWTWATDTNTDARRRNLIAA